MASSDGDSAIADELKRVQRYARGLQRVPAAPGIAVQHSGEEDSEWAVVIAPGERAMYLALDGGREVRVQTHRYTPRGLMYELEPPPGMKDWLVSATNVQPIHGETKLLRVNLVTGETTDLKD